MDLKYEPLEKISLRKPVRRISYICSVSANKNVLDIGSLDETAYSRKSPSEHLFSRLAGCAGSLTGIDNSSSSGGPAAGAFGSGRILTGDAYALKDLGLNTREFDLVVAGELIEHLPDVLKFFSLVKETFPGKEFICSTPNASSLTNVLLGLTGRESTHADHLHLHSVKILNTLCVKCGFIDWEIVPYHVYYSEMIASARGFQRVLARVMEKTVNFIEYLFPFLSGGLILHVRQV